MTPLQDSDFNKEQSKRIQKLIATPVGGVWFQFAGYGGQ